MDLLKHIIYVDKKEEILLFTELLNEISLPYELHSFHNYLNAEEFLQFENIAYEMIIVGSGIIHLYGDARLNVFRNNKILKKIPLVILIQSELCRQYLIKIRISNLQYLERPFDLKAYKETVRKLLLPSYQM